MVVETADAAFQAGGAWTSAAACRRRAWGPPALVQAALERDLGAFDARGRRLAWAPGSWRGAGVTEVPLWARRTPYVRTGDLSGGLRGALAAGGMVPPGGAPSAAAVAGIERQYAPNAPGRPRQ